MLSPDACDFSLDEGCDSEDDSERDYDFSSDDGTYTDDDYDYDKSLNLLCFSLPLLSTSRLLYSNVSRV